MLGDLVRDCRRRLGWSQEDLAARAGVSVRAIRKIETHQTGTPRPATVRLLADAFGLRDAERDAFCRIGLEGSAGSRRWPGRPPTGLPEASSASDPLPTGPGGALPAAWSGTATSSGRTSPSPAQLPVAIPTFTGRDVELAQLDALLPAGSGPDPLTRVPAMVISAVSGTAGVGKTTLAVHWAHRARHAFPDGQLYVNLRGFDPGGSTLSPAEAVRGFLDALGVPPPRIPSGLEARVGLYRSLLTDRRVLVVLDNARDAEQVRPLLPGSSGCLALVTSRNRLTGLAVTEGARLLTVDLLTPVQARELLSARLGARRVDAEPAAVRQIVARCAGLPLALAIVAARADAQPDLPLTALAGELRDAGDRLDALDVGETGAQVRSVLSWSYHVLGDEAARIFRLLGLHPGPDVAAPAVAALGGVSPTRARGLLAELTRGHLVIEHTPGRYALHDLLRAYATELVTAHDSPGSRHAATRRMLDHYLHTSHAADSLLTRKQDMITLGAAAPGAGPQSPGDHLRAMAWFSNEYPILLTAVDRRPTGFDTHVWQLASTLTTFLDRQGHWPALAAAGATALAAALRQQDRAGQATARRCIGLAQARMGHPDAARAQYRRALDLFRELDSHPGQARTYQDLARISGSQGRPEEALDHARHSLHHYQAADDAGGQSAALNHIGWFLAQVGDHHQALTYCTRALDLAQGIMDVNGQAHIWDSLGYIHNQLGRHRQAIDSYQQAIPLFHRTGDRHSEATGLAYLGDALHASGDPAAARSAWRQALTITDELGLPELDPLRAKIAGCLAPGPRDAMPGRQVEHVP